MNEALTVLAECVDKRSGKRYVAGEEFDPAPDIDQAKRLIAAGCLPDEALAAAQAAAKSKKSAPAAPQPADDGLDALTVEQLKTFAGEEKVDLGQAIKKEDIIAAIRAKRG
ncbi:MAG: hypothetical protein ACTHJV_19070 [Rhizobiaceae bacterium]